MKKFILLLIVIAIFFGIGIRLNYNSSSKLLIETFNQSIFKPEQSNINTYAILDKPINTFEEMEEYIQLVSAKSGSKYNYETTKEDDNNIKSLKRIYVSKEAKFSIQLQTVNFKNTYLIMDIILYKNFEDILTIKKELDDVLKQLNLKFKTNILITGTYKGNMSYNEKKSIAFDIMKNINAKVKEDYITDKVYSVVGYTRKINEYIYSQQQKINIHLALRYNEYDDKTYLYLATPMITVEY